MPECTARRSSRLVPDPDAPTLTDPLRRSHRDIATLVTDLTRVASRGTTACHLDPDLDAASLPRLAGWRGALGQVSTAQTHLANNLIAPGDLFLVLGIVQSGGPKRRRALALHRTRRTPHLRLAADRRDPHRRRGSNAGADTVPLARLASTPRHRLEQEQHRLRRARRTRYSPAYAEVFPASDCSAPVFA